MADEKKKFSFFYARSKASAIFFRRIGIDARKLSDHTISIGGRSLILDKSLY